MGAVQESVWLGRPVLQLPEGLSVTLRGRQAPWTVVGKRLPSGEGSFFLSVISLHLAWTLGRGAS